MVLHSKEAHTAEHIFAGSLQRIVSNMFVRKVEHTDSVNRVYIKSPELNLDAIYEAEVMVNKVISENRGVKEHNFNSLEDARKAFPQMRAYEERILENVRVVEIDGYDYAACAREHSQSTAECGFFLVTHVSRERDEHAIEFVVGEQARMSAVELSMKCIRVARELGANMNTFEATARNLKGDLEMYKKRLATVTERLIDGMVPQRRGNYVIYSAIFEMLDDSTLMKRVGDMIKESYVITALINIQANESGIVFIACNDMVHMNCGDILKAVLNRFEGKGGGTQNFATGSVQKEKAREVLDALLQVLNSE
jgi:alanyl-tRNA synthetase